MIASPHTNRTNHILALMKRGDDGFNSRDEAIFAEIHHPDMVAHIMGSPKPLQGRDALAAALAGMIKAFPDVRVENDPFLKTALHRHGTCGWHRLRRRY